MNPFAFWGWLLWLVEGRFRASHPLPSLPASVSRAIAFVAQARNLHALITGLSGSGKSVLLTQLVGQETVNRVEGKSNKGVAVFDPAGDMIVDLKQRFSVLSTHFPVLRDLIVIIDPVNPHWSVRLNLLEPVGDQTPFDRAVMLADTINAVYQDDETVTVQLRLLMINCFLAAIYAGLSILDMPNLLMDEEYRTEVVLSFRKEQPALYRYWTNLFPQSDSEVRKYISSTANRLLPLTDNPRLASLLEPPATVNFRDLLDKGCIILVNAPKGTLSPMGSYLLCGILLAEISLAAQSRTNVPQHERRPFMVVCDEYQTYATKTLVEIITENRKYGLELVLASQQIIARGSKYEVLQRQIHKTVGTLVHFRASSDDADIAVPDLFTFDHDDVKYVRQHWQKPFGMDVLYEEPVFYDLSDKREAARALLVNLPNREFLVKQRGLVGAMHGRTLDIPAAPNDRQALAHLDEEAFRRYGALKTDKSDQADEPPLIPSATVG